MGSFLLAVLIVQIAVPSRVATASVGNESQEFAEDGEPTEESETDGEQILFAMSGAQSVRSRQPGVRFVAPRATGNARRRAANWTTCIAAEMQQRNGIGGPLRC